MCQLLELQIGKEMYICTSEIITVKYIKKKACAPGGKIRRFHLVLLIIRSDFPTDKQLTVPYHSYPTKRLSTPDTIRYDLCRSQFLAEGSVIVFSASGACEKTLTERGAAVSSPP